MMDVQASDDLVGRLRNRSGRHPGITQAMDDAADEIERLRAQLAATEAERDKWIKHHESAIKIIEQQTERVSATEAQLETARKALEAFCDGYEAQDNFTIELNTAHRMGHDFLRSLNPDGGGE